MKILSDQEINDACAEVLNRALLEDSFYITHLELLFRYGLRISEVVQDDKIYKTSSGELFVWMKKTKRYRVIPQDDFIDNLDTGLLLSKNTMQNINEQNLKRLISYYLAYRQLFIGSKNIVSHLFRHNFAKQKFARLESVRLVNELLQEVSENVCEGYINSEIWYND